MIADNRNIFSKYDAIKIFITPNLRRLRTLFFLLFFLSCLQNAFPQAYNVDSLIQWVNTHPENDSTKIHKMHRISYLLSETDVNKSFAYYQRVSSLSDSLNFTFGRPWPARIWVSCFPPREILNPVPRLFSTPSIWRRPVAPDVLKPSP